MAAHTARVSLNRLSPVETDRNRPGCNSVGEYGSRVIERRMKEATVLLVTVYRVFYLQSDT
jgi:hypothetical protein